MRLVVLIKSIHIKLNYSTNEKYVSGMLLYKVMASISSFPCVYRAKKKRNIVVYSATAGSKHCFNVSCLTNAVKGS